MKEKQFQVFDIETDEKNGSGLLGDSIFLVITEPDGVVFDSFNLATVDPTDWILSDFLVPEKNGFILYAHNGIGFDFKRIDWNRILDSGFTARLIGSSESVKSITIQKKTLSKKFSWHLQDSLLKCPMGLDKMGKTFAGEGKKDKDFSVSRFDPENLQDVAYARQDGTLLHKALKNYDTLMKETFGCSIHESPTLPSFAMRAFRKFSKESGSLPQPLLTSHWEKADESYYGGMTLAYNNSYHKNEIGIDANSLYGWVMLEFPLPTGLPSFHRETLHDLPNEKFSLCFATVDIPSSSFPVLKTRYKNRVKNAVGRVTGWYWDFELALQRETGCEFVIHERLSWENETRDVSRFIEKCRDLRMKDYHGPIGQIAKLVQNSLYGKFAQKHGASNIVLARVKPHKSALRYIPFEEEETDGIWWEYPGNKRFERFPHWGSYITARSREKLLGTVKSLGFEKVDYVDTDSIFMEDRFRGLMEPFLGNDYGNFKVEKEFSLFRPIAPKAYEYVKKDEFSFLDKEKSFGPPSKKRVNKGVPLSTLSCPRTDAEEIEFIGHNSLVRMLREGKTVGQKTERKLAHSDNIQNGSFGASGKWVPDEWDIGKREWEEDRDKRKAIDFSNRLDEIMKRWKTE